MVRSMCPSCGFVFDTKGNTIPDHSPAPPTRELCAGSGQGGRDPDTDRRPLWNGRPNPHIQAAADQFPPGPVTTTTAGPRDKGIMGTLADSADSMMKDGIASADIWPLPVAKLTDAAVTINGRPTRVVGSFELVPVGMDANGNIWPVDALKYGDTKAIVNSRLHPDDLLGRVIEWPHLACSVCAHPLDYFNNGRHTGTEDGAGGFTCPACTRPPDAPHVV